MRINNYLKNLEDCNNVLYNSSNTDFLEIYYSGKYLSSNQEIRSLLISLLEDSSQVSQVKAFTGAGKTDILVREVFPELILRAYKEDSKVLNILCTPYKSQSEQAEFKYPGLQVLYGGKEDLSQIDVINKSIISVYDKITLLEIKLLYTKYPDLRINLVIDEAHNLVSSCGFRPGAIKELEEVKNYIIERGGNVILLTASPDVLVYDKINNVLNFTTEKEYKANTKKFNVFFIEGDFENAACSIISRTDKNLIRWNSKLNQKAFVNYFNKNKKPSIWLNTEEKEREGDSYKNKAFDSLIKEETLPPDYSNVFTTSVIDAGINIKKPEISEEVGEEERKKAEASEFKNIYFLIPDAMNLDLMNIEQFFNRTRYEAETYNIIIRKPKNPIEEVKEFSEIFKKDFYLVNKQMEGTKLLVDNKIEYLKSLNDNGEIDSRNRKEILTLANQLLNFKDIDNKKESLNILSFDVNSLELRFDKRYFTLKVYEKYMKQLFNAPNRLLKELKEIFNCDINVEELGGVKIIDFRKELEDDALEFLKQNIDKKKEEIKEELKLYTETRKVKDFENLQTLGYTKEEALKCINDKKKEEIKSLTEDTIKARIYDFLNSPQVNIDSTLELLKLTLKDKAKLEDKNIPGDKNFIRILISSNTYYTFLKEIDKKSYSLLEAIKYIKDYSTSGADLKRYINRYQYLYFNTEYMRNALNLKTRAGLQQKIILDEFFLKRDGDIKNLGLYINKKHILNIIGSIKHIDIKELSKEEKEELFKNEAPKVIDVILGSMVLRHKEKDGKDFFYPSYIAFTSEDKQGLIIKQGKNGKEIKKEISRRDILNSIE